MDSTAAEPSMTGRPGRAVPVDLAWQDNAACRDLDPAVFFPGYQPNGLPDPRYDPAPAKAICAGCPVTADCRAYALRAGIPGVWGATDTAERHRLTRKPRRQQGAPPAA